VIPMYEYQYNGAGVYLEFIMTQILLLQSNAQKTVLLQYCPEISTSVDIPGVVHVPRMNSY
jgi:hypothetical protein